MMNIEVLQTDFRSLEGPARILVVGVELGFPINQATDDESMEMPVGPGEGRLDDCVELGQSEVERQQDAAPDRRLDVLDSDLGLHDQLFIELHDVDNADGRRRRQQLMIAERPRLRSRRAGRVTANCWRLLELCSV